LKSNLSLKSTRILSIGIKYSISDLICVVIDYCALLWEKLGEYDQIVIKNLKRRTDVYQTLLHDFPSNKTMYE